MAWVSPQDSEANTLHPINSSRCQQAERARLSTCCEDRVRPRVISLSCANPSREIYDTDLYRIGAASMSTSNRRSRPKKQLAARKSDQQRSGRPRSAAADKAILKAAMKLFVQRGFDGTTLEDIAEKAGVARTTVYRRWSSKQALLAQAIAKGRGASEQEAAAGPGVPETLRDRLVDAAATALSAPNYRKVVARLVGSVPDHPELMSIYWKVYLIPRRAAMKAVLERGQNEGLVRRDLDPEILLDLIGGAVMHELLVRPGTPSAQSLREYLHRVLGALDLENWRRSREPAHEPVRQTSRSVNKNEHLQR